jgi:hypothetical protein
VTAIAVAGASISVTRAPVDWTSIVAAVVTTISISIVVPGARADKDSANKPRRTVVSVRGARVRIVAVVPIRADRSGIAIAIAAIYRAADSDPHRYLGMRISRCREQQNTEYSEIA